MGVLATIGADALAQPAGGGGRAAPVRPNVRDGQDLSSEQDLSRHLEREISRGIGDALAARDQRAAELRSDIAMVLREIDAGGTVFRAAIETGDTEVEHEVLAAFEALSSEFGDMAFMLADLARAAGEIQDSLGGQGAELRAASLQVGRQAADVRMIREELAVIEQRARQWQPDPAGPAEPGTALDRLPVPRAAPLRPGARGGVPRPGAADRGAGGQAGRDRDRHGHRGVGGRQDLAAAGRAGARAGPGRPGARARPPGR